MFLDWFDHLSPQNLVFALRVFIWGPLSFPRQPYAMLLTLEDGGTCDMWHNCGAEGFGESVTQSHRRNMAGLLGAWVKPWEIPSCLHCMSPPSACLWDSWVKDFEKHWPSSHLCAEKALKSVLSSDFPPKKRHLQYHINNLLLDQLNLNFFESRMSLII